MELTAMHNDQFSETMKVTSKGMWFNCIVGIQYDTAGECYLMRKLRADLIRVQTIALWNKFQI
jgi:hypothetical protein